MIPAHLKSNHIFAGGRWGAMSGEKPLYPAQVEATHENLVRALKGMGIHHHETQGRYGDPERSVLLYNPEREQMHRLGKMFGQESVVFSQGGNHELLYTNGPHEGKSRLVEPGREPMEYFPDPPDDNYTKLPGQGYLRVNFDFSRDPEHRGQGLGKSEPALVPQRPWAHPHAYEWHDGSTEHHQAVAPDPVPVLKAEPGNDQAAGVGVSTYKKFATPYGQVLGPQSPTDLFHYDYRQKLPEIEKQVKAHGYQVYYGGGKYGKPDLAHKNYDSGHLMVWDPTPGSGGDFGEENQTRGWRQIHELAHALTLPEVNRIYGEGRRMGRLGTHRTQNEAMRAVHWEWLAAHKQRELSQQIGVHVPDHVFHRELNTVMHDAVHRAVTGKFTEPSAEGFKPHDHLVPLATALDAVRGEAQAMGLRGHHDLSVRKSEDLQKAFKFPDVAPDHPRIEEIRALQHKHKQLQRRQGDRRISNSERSVIGQQLGVLRNAFQKLVDPNHTDTMEGQTVGVPRKPVKPVLPRRSADRAASQGVNPYTYKNPGATVQKEHLPKLQGPNGYVPDVKWKKSEPVIYDGLNGSTNVSDEKTYSLEEVRGLALKKAADKIRDFETELKAIRGRELAKALIPPHKHTGGTTTSAGTEDVAGGKMNPPGLNDPKKAEPSWRQKIKDVPVKDHKQCSCGNTGPTVDGLCGSCHEAYDAGDKKAAKAKVKKTEADQHGDVIHSHAFKPGGKNGTCGAIVRLSGGSEAPCEGTEGDHAKAKVKKADKIEASPEESSSPEHSHEETPGEMEKGELCKACGKAGDLCKCMGKAEKSGSKKNKCPTCYGDPQPAHDPKQHCPECNRIDRKSKDSSHSCDNCGHSWGGEDMDKGVDKIVVHGDKKVAPPPRGSDHVVKPGDKKTVIEAKKAMLSDSKGKPKDNGIHPDSVLPEDKKAKHVNKPEASDPGSGGTIKPVKKAEPEKCKNCGSTEPMQEHKNISVNGKDGQKGYRCDDCGHVQLKKATPEEIKAIQASMPGSKQTVHSVQKPAAELSGASEAIMPEFMESPLAQKGHVRGQIPGLQETRSALGDPSLRGADRDAALRTAYGSLAALRQRAAKKGYGIMGDQFPRDVEDAVQPQGPTPEPHNIWDGRAPNQAPVGDAQDKAADKKFWGDVRAGSKPAKKAEPPMAKPPQGSPNMATSVPTSKPKAANEAQVKKAEPINAAPDLGKAGMSMPQQHAMADASKLAAPKASAPGPKLPGAAAQAGRAQAFQDAGAGAFQPKGPVSSGLELAPKAAKKPGIFGRLGKAGLSDQKAVVAKPLTSIPKLKPAGMKYQGTLHDEVTHTDAPKIPKSAAETVTRPGAPASLATPPKK